MDWKTRATAGHHLPPVRPGDHRGFPAHAADPPRPPGSCGAVPALHRYDLR